MTTLTRERLLQHAQIPDPEPVDVPDLGKVYLQPVSEVQRVRRAFQYQSSNGTSATDRKAYYRVNAIIDQVCDEKGEPLFSEADRETLGDLNAKALDALSTAIEAFNGDTEKNESGESTDTPQNSA